LKRRTEELDLIHVGGIKVFLKKQLGIVWPGFMIGTYDMLRDDTLLINVSSGLCNAQEMNGKLL
jgi:hypothetical protein